MIFKDNGLYEKSKITQELIEILSEEYHFETIELSMPDIITCHMHGSKYLPKATSVNDSPMILCSFAVYNNSVVFGVSCFEAKGNEYIIDRLNNELLYLKEPIKNINKIATLINLKILNESDMEYLKRTTNTTLRYRVLKAKIDEFFEEKGNKIISKIVEIMMGVKI